MSELSYLEKLLDGVEVEWRNLGDTSLFEIANNGRKPVKASLRIAGETPYYGANNIQDYVDGYTHDGEYVLIAEDGSASLENYSIQYATGKFWANNHVHVVRGKERVHSRFLYHYLCIVNFLPFLTGGGRAKLTKGQLIEIPVPIPCPDNPEKSLAIQSEIVRILDKFTALTAELTAELTARKKQYNYYRDQLLSFKEGEVEWKTLGEVATFRRGTAITQKQTTPGDIPVVANGPTPTYFHSESNRQDETIVIARSGAYAGYVSFWNQPIFLTDAFSVHPNLKIVKPKFLYYVLQNKQEHIHAMKKGAGVPHVRVKEFESYDVPIPPLAEQVRIVTILDKFDTLTNSITEGLPREIELRQKQYEYYRDMLFSFPKPDVVEA
ncbi:restriction endonuclease subunit S [Klebsiella pneumoniae]|uniref:restriction endonuclease subunit S n=1 Tax=Klebsiella pneumoniae TaxID=573 RepID=UPI001BFE505A|nr:restriction endonuclease subunit S [Klebsiella pneumoniae]MCM2226326.1 restriction endonuclease subunit S [Klebsiella pneumoniae]WRS63873.1 restriction endonuclease subunit S [Klebsiella pneumoniae]